MSTTISRFEKLISAQWGRVDAVGKILLQRVTDLLAARQDMSRADFGRRISRGHSWISEFFAALRTTNDLRLVVKMAHVFGVPVSYLLAESNHEQSPETITLLAAWPELDERAQRAVLNLALMLKDGSDDPGTSPARGSHDGPLAGGGTTKARGKRR